MSNVREILGKKGNKVWSVTSQETIFNTLKLMAEKNVGAVLVVDGEKIAGIFSERDFARHIVKKNLQLQETPVKSVMTSRIIFVHPSQTTEECMSIMTNKRIRHLPVMEEGKLIGVISIGDVVSKIIDDYKFSISQLEQYVTGEY